jgi:hypothetical protein
MDRATWSCQRNDALHIYDKPYSLLFAIRMLGLVADIVQHRKCSTDTRPEDVTGVSFLQGNVHVHLGRNLSLLVTNYCCQIPSVNALWSVFRLTACGGLMQPSGAFAW